MCPIFLLSSSAIGETILPHWLLEKSTACLIRIGAGEELLEVLAGRLLFC